jgi:hypothetical protein
MELTQGLSYQAVTTGKDPPTFRKTYCVHTWDETVQINRLFVFIPLLVFEYAVMRLFRNEFRIRHEMTSQKTWIFVSCCKKNKPRNGVCMCKSKTVKHRRHNFVPQCLSPEFRSLCNWFKFFTAALTVLWNWPLRNLVEYTDVSEERNPTLSPTFLLAQAIFEPNIFPYEYPNISWT